MASPEAPSYRALLASPGLAPLLAATLLSRLATRMFSLVIVLYMLARFGSPALAGWATFLSIAPGLAISPLAATALDRLGLRRGIGVDLTLGAAIMASVAAFDTYMPASIVLLLMALYSLTSPLGTGGIRAALPRLVPEPLWPRVNALDTATYGVVDVVGPAIGGIVIAALGGRVAFGLIAATYAASVLCLLAVGRVAAPTATQRGLFADTLDGFLHFARHKTLRALALCYSLLNAGWGALIILVPVVAREALGDRGDTAAGVLWALAGASGIVGALVSGRLAVAGNERRILAWGMVIVALATFPLAAYGGLWGLAAAMVVMGLANGPIDVGLITLRQRRTNPAWFARVLVISMSFNVVGMPLGAAFAGQLVHVALPLAFAAAALVTLAAAASVALVPSEAEAA